MCWARVNPVKVGTMTAPAFTGEETEVRRHLITCPKSHSQQPAEQNAFAMMDTNRVCVGHKGASIPPVQIKEDFSEEAALKPGYLRGVLGL